MIGGITPEAKTEERMKLRMMSRIAAGAAALTLLLTGCSGAAKADANYKTVKIDGYVYLLSDPSYYYDPEAVKEQARSFNQALEDYPEVESYIYLLNSSRTTDMEHIAEEPRIYSTIVKAFSRSVTAYLKMDSAEDYARYFYTTDHHWKYEGSYTGYCQMIHMMLGEDEPVLEPEETVEFPFVFNGSMNESLKRADSKEKFTVYRFAYPPMKIEINGREKASYGHQEEYFAGKYSKMVFASHYSFFYGGEEGLIHFQTEKTDEKNLLVFSNSQSNAVDMLLACHYANTWIVDPRHYEADNGKAFSLSDAVKEWKIDQVLILGDGHYFKQPYHYH